MSNYIKILGCGNSMGVPAAGNIWGQCDPKEPKNIRKRASILIKKDNKNIVIDTGADFRAQTLEYNINHIDAVIYSHYHGDHCHGIDDLRPFFRESKKAIPIYSDLDTIENLSERFPYCFKESLDGFYKAIVEPNIWTNKHFGYEQNIQGISITPFIQDHLSCKSIGVRVGDVAYSTDFASLDEFSLNCLKGINTWIADGAGYWDDEIFVHCTIKQLIKYNEIIGAKRVIVTDLSTRMDYKKLTNELPEGFEPAYDGLIINL